MPTIIKPKNFQKPQAPKPPVTRFHGVNSNSNVDDGNDENDENENNQPPSPPMPKCPPPLLPASASSTNEFSMLDVINGKIDILNLNPKYDNGRDFQNLQCNDEPYGIALYDFEGSVDGDLSFRENEKIYILEKLNEDWLKGRTRSGCEGIFPANYIEIKVPLNNLKNSYSKIDTKKSNKIEKQQSRKIKCLYLFNAEEPGDLALKENDYVTVLYRINEDWLYGEIDGRKGQFPANFLEYIPTNLPLMPTC